MSRDYNIIIDACLRICPFTQDCGLDQCVMYIMQNSKPLFDLFGRRNGLMLSGRLVKIHTWCSNNDKSENKNRFYNANSADTDQRSR